ncbi:MAG: hypothetical protein LC664_06060 [Flavobacteriales bacterium]|nr:hypothetical protein [Flavobacteriales bacterium]
MKTAFLSFLILALVWACASSGKTDADEKPKADMNQSDASELALLMRTIHQDAKSWRAAIENGDLVSREIDIYQKMVESTPTKPDVKGPAFEGFAKHYQMQIDSLTAAKDISLAADAYNNLVSSCITCHESFCPGPVKTIKKLYISDAGGLSQLDK